MKYISLDADTAAMRHEGYDNATGMRRIVYQVIRTTDGVLGHVPNAAIFTETAADVFSQTLNNSQVDITFGPGTMALLQADFAQDYS